MFNQLEQLRKSNGDPFKLFKELSSNYSTEQMEVFWKNVSQFGIPSESIQKFQNEIAKK